MAAAEILRTHVHEQAGIRVFPVSGPQAHAVRAQTALFRSGRHDAAARAHAERIDAPAGFRAHGQLVFRRADAQIFVISRQLRHVDGFLRVFDAHAHGELLLFHLQPLPVEHGEAVPCAVTQRKKERVRLYGFGCPVRR